MPSQPIQEAVPFEVHQQHFVLTLEEVNRTGAVLSTQDGTVVRVPLAFVGLRPSSEIRRTVLRDNYWGEVLTAKHLGIYARRGLGLPGRTPLHTSTRILWQGAPLHVHRPIATLLEVQSEEFQIANTHCLYCKQQLQHDDPRHSGPFHTCYFCYDTPAWHHGECCPFNPGSKHFHGRSHTQRFEAAFHSARVP